MTGPADPAALATRDADWAASGVVPLTGMPDAAPLRPPGAAATAATRLLEWYGTLAATLGCPVRVDGAALLAERAALTGAHRRGATSPGGACRLLPAGDGVLAVSLPRVDDAALVGALVGDAVAGSPYDAVARWARDRPVAQVVEAAGLLGLAVAGAGSVTWVPRRCAAADLVRAAATSPPGTPSPLPSPTGPGWEPGHGPLVVDFSALWAGPLCAHLLGLAGARVVKVETAVRPDGARRGNRAFYTLLHSGHAAVQVDPSRPGDLALLHDLVAAADVVVEASRPLGARRVGARRGGRRR